MVKNNDLKMGKIWDLSSNVYPGLTGRNTPTQVPNFLKRLLAHNRCFRKVYTVAL